MKKDPEGEATRVATLRAWIKVQANDLAKQYQIDASRVCRILERTAGGPYWPVSPDGLDEVIPEDHAHFPYTPSLRVALHHLRPEDALALFEHADLDQLRQREYLVTYLSLSHAFHPFYTLDELADVTVAFIAYLERNRDAFVCIGLPRVLFGRSDWLNRLLTSLYPTRRPLGGGVEFVDDEYEGHTVIHAWPERYEDAPPLQEGLDPANAARLETLRATLFELELAIVRELLAAARRRSAVGLWPACLRLLTEALSADDANFLLRMDRFYQGHDARDEPTEQQAGFPLNGLTGLLQLIGEYEELLTTRRFARLREALLTFPEFDWLHDATRAIGSYYQIRSPRDRERLDPALDAFLAAGPQAAAFWGEYRRRVNEALENEFYAEVVVRVKVRQKLLHQFEPHLRRYGAIASNFLEERGSLPQLALSASAANVTSEGNIFRKEGQYWTIKYQGKVTRVSESTGWSYIAHLIHHAGQEFHALDLVAVHKGREISSAGDQHSRMTRDELAEVGLSASGLGNAGELLDPQARQEYKRQWDDYQEELRQAKADNNIELVAQLEAAIAYLAREVSAAVGLGGRVRKAADSAERARKSISNAIKRSLDNIEHDHPALHEHLNSGIRRGTYFSYDPATSPDWNR